MKLKNLLSKKKEPDWQEYYHYQKARADALEVKVFHLVDGLDKILNHAKTSNSRINTNK